MKKVLFLALVFVTVVAPVHAKEGREEIREMKASRAAEIKDIREGFRAKLKTIRDERKKTIVENLDKRFAEVNAKRTSEMAKHLDKMTEILGKTIPEIQTARDANTAQAAKSYVITITTEANLKTDVATVRKQLEMDLKAVHDLVVTARAAVRASIK